MHELTVFRARILSCATRLALWQHLGQCPAYPGDIARTFGLAYSTVSYHLSLLQQAGLVAYEQQGRCRLYRWTGVRMGVLSADEIADGIV